MEIADHPVGGVERCIEVIQDPIEMTLQRPAELEEIPFSYVPIGTSCGFTEGYGGKWEAIELLLWLKKIGVYGMGIFRGRKELPTGGSGKEHLHLRTQRVRRHREGGFLKEVEAVRDTLSGVMIHMRGETVASGGAVRKDISITPPMREFEDGWEVRCASYAIEEWL